MEAKVLSIMYFNPIIPDMPGDRILSSQDARVKATDFYWKMENLTQTYHSGPRWGGAIYADDGSVVRASCDGRVDAPAGERWPLVLGSDIDLKKAFPQR